MILTSPTLLKGNKGIWVNSDNRLSQLYCCYKKYMGGVNHGDQLQSYYPVRLKSRKFYMYVFWFLFDVVVTNFHILSCYAITTNREPISRQSRKNFRLKVASQLIGNYCSRVRLGQHRFQPLPLQPNTGESSQQRALLIDLPCKAKALDDCTVAKSDALLRGGKQFDIALDAKTMYVYFIQNVPNQCLFRIKYNLPMHQTHYFYCCPVSALLRCSCHVFSPVVTQVTNYNHVAFLCNQL